MCDGEDSSIPHLSSSEISHAFISTMNSITSLRSNADSTTTFSIGLAPSMLAEQEDVLTVKATCVALLSDLCAHLQKENTYDDSDCWKNEDVEEIIVELMTFLQSKWRFELYRRLDKITHRNILPRGTCMIRMVYYLYRFNQSPPSSTMCPRDVDSRKTDIDEKQCFIDFIEMVKLKIPLENDRLLTLLSTFIEFEQTLSASTLRDKDHILPFEHWGDTEQALILLRALDIPTSLWDQVPNNLHQLRLVYSSALPTENIQFPWSGLNEILSTSFPFEGEFYHQHFTVRSIVSHSETHKVKAILSSLRNLIKKMASTYMKYFRGYVVTKSQLMHASEFVEKIRDILPNNSVTIEDLTRSYKDCHVSKVKAESLLESFQQKLKRYMFAHPQYWNITDQNTTIDARNHRKELIRTILISIEGSGKKRLTHYESYNTLSSKVQEIMKTIKRNYAQTPQRYDRTQNPADYAEDSPPMAQTNIQNTEEEPLALATFRNGSEHDRQEEEDDSDAEEDLLVRQQPLRQVVANLKQLSLDNNGKSVYEVGRSLTKRKRPSSSDSVPKKPRLEQVLLDELEDLRKFKEDVLRREEEIRSKRRKTTKLLLQQELEQARATLKKIAVVFQNETLDSDAKVLKLNEYIGLSEL